jgi:hypothetical protein
MQFLHIKIVVLFNCFKVVLPDRIELSTSPLPMECSTTELRQQARKTRIGRKGPTGRADPCHKARRRASAGLALRRPPKPPGKQD